MIYALNWKVEEIFALIRETKKSKILKALEALRKDEIIEGLENKYNDV